MKRLFPLLFTAALSAASLSVIGNPVLNPATVIQDDRNVKNFSGVAAGGPIEVIITLGNTESIKFEGDAAAIATLVTEVKSNVLIIRPSVSWKSWAKKYEGKKITAYVNAKNISSLTMSGDGSILVKGTVTAAELATTLSGSGSIKASISADELTSTLSGSGSLELTGKATSGSVNISGSGRLNGKTLAINNLNARISGSGSVYAKVDGTINAMISGSGHVYYAGNPSIEQKSIGSGGVSKF
ncbi:MAG TPA: head GIN domain-containing protein [Pedobacter sp.]|uniref:head GIN domain-containing protein n=1 Tax=Pedobacter sp. TaxID=1411316 RepID=UPI002B5D1A88|nr:head GIN domain-containing protein [Pedobacter sp.]HMI04227.1 head GIN domain-containing protein [Pedobacter sp.]